MKHTLIKLNFEYSSLEPYIDSKTMEIHHSKHHQTYVDNLNTALDKYPELFDKTLEELLTNLDFLPQEIAMAVKNNGGGVYNHNFFWSILSPIKSDPSEEISSAINNSFGTFENFKEAFTKSALSRFGSGWAWLVLNKDKELEILSTPNQDSPISEGKVPLLTVDVWEHAYYLKYQNRRKEYLDNYWNVINWDKVSQLYKSTQNI